MRLDILTPLKLFRQSLTSAHVASFECDSSQEEKRKLKGKTEKKSRSMQKNRDWCTCLTMQDVDVIKTVSSLGRRRSRK